MVTGTTWTQEMVWMIAHDCDTEAAKESLITRSPFIEYKLRLFFFCSHFRKADLIFLPICYLLPLDFQDSIKSFKYQLTHFQDKNTDLEKKF